MLTRHERSAVLMDRLAALLGGLSKGGYCEVRLKELVETLLGTMVQSVETFDATDRCAAGILRILLAYLGGDPLLQFAHPNDQPPRPDLLVIPSHKIEDLLRQLREKKGE
jgi:hypothetical protein